MIYLFLAILSSTLISLIMRASSNKADKKLSMLAANYVVCSLLAVLSSKNAIFAFGRSDFSNALILGIINGALYLTSFILFQYSTQKNGIVLSSVFMKLGLLVPMAVSVIFFKEIPLPLQIIGFLAAIVAILLINWQKGVKLSGSALILLFLLLTGGMGDAMAKIFERRGSADFSGSFLFFTFFSALLFCLALICAKREKPNIKSVVWGALIGIPNFFSAKFLLLSLSSIKAVIAYPTYSVTTILLVTLIGTILFKERLKKLQWIALCIILIALILLNI